MANLSNERWAFKESSDPGRYKVLGTIPGKKFTIAIIPFTSTGDSEKDELLKKEAEDHARLIAAAPELLEALEDADKTIEYLQNKFISMEKEHDHAATRTGNARRNILLALQKAKP